MGRGEVGDCIGELIGGMTEEKVVEIEEEEMMEWVETEEVEEMMVR